MNQTVIEAQARYLIEDRVSARRRTPAPGPRRRHHRFPRPHWL
ncbi:MAG: hypothetical protein QM747_08265 [Nocardioides sp.]